MNPSANGCLLQAQPYQELLLCLPRIDPKHLSLQALAVPGSDPVVRAAYPALFREAETRLKQGADAAAEVQAIEEYISRAGQ